MNKAFYIAFLLGLHFSGKAQFKAPREGVNYSFIVKPFNVPYYPQTWNQQFQVITSIDSLSYRTIYIEEKYLKNFKIEANKTYKITGLISIKTENDLICFGSSRTVSYIYIKPTLSSVLIQQHLEVIN